MTLPTVRRGGALLLTTGAVAAVVNANFLLDRVVGSPVDLGTGVISELSVHGLPGWWLFRLGDGSTGVLGALLGFAAWRSGRRVTGVASVVFGVGTLLSALIPLSCAPSLGGCVGDDPTGFVHDLVSTVGTAGAIVAAAMLVHELRGRSRVLRGTALLVALGTALPGLGQTIDAASGGSGGGIVQQVQVLAVSGWLLLEGVAAVLPRTGRRRRPRS